VKAKPGTKKKQVTVLEQSVRGPCRRSTAGMIQMAEKERHDILTLKINTIMN